MNTANKKARREKTKSNAHGFGSMEHGMSEMMKCCTGRGSYPDCLTMMKEMKKQCRAQQKNAAESERKTK